LLLKTLIYSINRYIGYRNENITKEMEDVIDNDHHTLLLDENERIKLKSYTDFSCLPENYKNKSYYQDENILKLISSLPAKLEESSILRRDKNFAHRVKEFFREDVSPGNFIEKKTNKRVKLVIQPSDEERGNIL